MRSLALLAAATVGVTVLIATPAVGQQGPVLTLSPNTGAPGTSFKLSWTGLFFDPDCTSFAMRVLWDGQQVVGSGTGSGRGTGSGSATVPTTANAGGHRVTAQGISCTGAVSNTYTVIVPIPPTTTTTNPPVTTTTTTRPPVVTTTTRPGQTTTTTPPTTTTTDSSSTTTTTPGSSTSGTDSFDSGDGILVLDKDNIQPGDPLTATGTGCPAGAPVTLKARGEDVGKAVADSKGEFTAPVRFTTIEPGRHVVRAECGITLLGNVDVALSSSTGGTTSTLVVLVFFLLIGATMLRRQFTGLRATA